MTWARDNGYVVFTHDLDFEAILAVSDRLSGPSVLQVRTQDILPATLGPSVLAVLRDHHVALEAGALVVLDAAKARVRLLPLPSR